MNNDIKTSIKQTLEIGNFEVRQQGQWEHQKSKSRENNEKES